MRSVRCSKAAAVSILGVSALVTGCSGGGSAALPSTTSGISSISPRGAVLAARSSQGVYLVTGTTSGQYVINEYPLNDKKNSAPLCQILAGTSIFPGDLAIGTNGNLWVPTIATPSISSVWEVVPYAPGCGQQQGAPLEDTNSGEPIGIAFDSKDTAYVANEVDSSFGPGNVAVFPAGKTSPTKVLTSPLIGAYVLAIAIDGSDNVYVAFDNSSYHTEVLEFAKGKGHGKAVNVTGYSVISGITFDKKQNLIITDYSAAQDEVYAAPYSGPPTSTIPLIAGSKPLFSKLNKSNNAMYVTGGTGLNVYSYPAGNFKYAVSNQMGQYGAGGVAVDPPSPL
jgi:hypothetical protein